MSKQITQVELPSRLRQWTAALRVALAVVGLGLAASCSQPSETPGAAAGGGRGRGAMAVPVDILTLAEKPVEQASEFVGTVKSLHSTTVQSQVEGFLLKVNV